MAIPSNALVWPEPMDSGDVVDYVVDCTPILDDGELISSFTIVPYAESTLLGLTIGTGVRAPIQIGQNKIRVWFSIAAGQVDNAAFSATSGASLPVQLTINTTSIPSRTKQRTLVVKVQQL